MTVTPDEIERHVHQENWHTLLLELLKAIHRDNGNFTVLAGMGVSIDEGIRTIGSLYKERAELRRKCGRK